MTETTRRLRESSVLIVDSHIPEGMTIAEYRRSRGQRENTTLGRRATRAVTRRLRVVPVANR